MANGLLLFVHGLGGNANKTWGKFEALAKADPGLADYDVAFFEYPTSLVRLPLAKKRPRIQTLAEALRTLLDIKYPDHDPVVLIAHSLGGLICRQYLIDRVMSEEPLRTKKLLLYAVPNDGAGLAEFGRHLSFRHRQLKQLSKDSDVIIDMNNAWTRLRMGDKLEIWSVVAALDRVVDSHSAKALPGTNQVQVLAGRGHKNCVKPKDESDEVYCIASRFATKVPQPNGHPDDADRPPPGPPGNFKVVGFDLDGTLIRGLTFSWTRVWSHLGYDDEVQSDGMRKYLTGRMTYREWCSWAVDMFRVRKLRKRDFAEIAQGLTLTNNLRPALASLRERGLVLCLFSGGIDTLMYELLPDADELFDHISINRLSFDPDGEQLISGVDATEHDFDGKLEGLKAIAAQHGATLRQTVFVGEGFNDAAVTAAAGLGIAYPPHDFATEASSDVQIEEDDLTKVVEAILSHQPR